MVKFEVFILGSSSSIPSVDNISSSQLIRFSNKYFLLDCAEGTQLMLKKNNISFLKIKHIFISHLHGDHFFGIFPLISSMALLGRITDLHIYSNSNIESIINKTFELSKSKLNYNIIYHIFPHNESALLYDDNNLEIWSIPLNHSIITNGFLFKEKKLDRKILENMLLNYEIPHYIIPEIKKGANYKDNDGNVLPNNILTSDNYKSRKYAYCTDTQYDERILEHINDCDYIYHEASFLEKDREIAIKTKHSTSKDAANIALKSNSKHLLIGHLSKRYNTMKLQNNVLIEAKSVFANTKLVKSGDVINIEYTEYETE